MKKMICALLATAMFLVGASCSGPAAFAVLYPGTLLNKSVISQEPVDHGNSAMPSTESILVTVPVLDMGEAQVPELAETEVPSVPDEYIELLALLTMAEAEGESEEGQRLVIDVVLNRVDSPHFPNSIYDVIWQKKQFSPMWNGRIKACHLKDEIVQLVREELESRTNHDVVFFRTERYHSYGVPMFQVGAHYFSSYD